MVDLDIIKYVEAELKDGNSLHSIKQALYEHGWSVPEIEKAVDIAQGAGPNLQARPEKKHLPPLERPPIILEKPLERPKHSFFSSSKAVIGFTVSVVASLLVIGDLLFKILEASVVNQLLLMFENLGMLGFIDILAFVFGIVILLGAVLVYRNMEKEGAILVVIGSVMCFFFTGLFYILLIGIVGGILALYRK